MFKPHPDFMKVLFVLFLGGLFLLYASLPGPANNANNPPSTGAAWLGLIFLAAAITGFFGLHLARQPNSKNPFAQTLQEIARSLLGTDDQLIAPLVVDETNKDDERKAAAAKERFKKDIQYKIDLEAGQGFYTREALNEWRKSQRKRISFDENLSGQEREDLLEALDDAYFGYRKKLKAKAEIFEDE